MVASALSILGIARGELKRTRNLPSDQAKSIEEQEWAALSWLQRWYNVRAATPEGCSYRAAAPYYYLYSLERAMILWGARRIGGHDWYLEGAAMLLSWQNPDGSWRGPHGTPVVDTCFALLFLKRAMLPVPTPTKVSRVRRR